MLWVSVCFTENYMKVVTSISRDCRISQSCQAWGTKGRAGGGRSVTEPCMLLPRLRRFLATLRCKISGDAALPWVTHQYISTSEHSSHTLDHVYYEYTQKWLSLSLLFQVPDWWLPPGSPFSSLSQSSRSVRTDCRALHCRAGSGVCSTEPPHGDSKLSVIMAMATGALHLSSLSHNDTKTLKCLESGKQRESQQRESHFGAARVPRSCGP
jgi:hypothetical protein